MAITGYRARPISRVCRAFSATCCDVVGDLRQAASPCVVGQFEVSFQARTWGPPHALQEMIDLRACSTAPALFPPLLRPKKIGDFNGKWEDDRVGSFTGDALQDGEIAQP